MHIVFPTMGLSKSGGDRVIIEIANGFVARGHKVTLLLSRPIQGKSFPIDQRINIEQNNSPRDIVSELWWLARAVPENADIVVGNYYLTAFPTVLATYWRRINGVYLVQDYEPDFFVTSPERKCPVAQRMLARISYRLPLFRITISSWLKSVLSKREKVDSVVVNDGVNTHVFAPSARKANNFKTIMCLGRNDNRKGFFYFLNALKFLHVPSKLKVLIVTQDINLVVNAPIDIDIEIIHPENDKELAACYNRADVFVFPSIREGFGLPPLEAMACGTPVVTTDNGGVSDYAETGKNCIVVPVKDPESIAAAIELLLMDVEKARKLSVAGRVTACNFTWDIMVSKLENIFRHNLDELVKSQSN